MEQSIANIAKLYIKYNSNPEILLKINYYIQNDLPKQLENYHDEQKKNIEIEKYKKIYINNFLTNPDKQFFYINTTIQTFAEYNGEDYSTITEDNLWYYILTDIPKKNYMLTDVKQNIKTELVKKIKKKSIFSTIPESITVQNIINFFCPIIFKTKQETKYFFSIIGDIILNKFISPEMDQYFFVSQKSKIFFETISKLFSYYFDMQLLWSKYLKFTYKNQEPSKCIVLYFKKHIHNKTYWKSFIECNFLNFIAVCCHYSNRYKNSSRFFNSIKNVSIKNKLLYINLNTKKKMIEKFFSNTFKHEKDKCVHIDDVLFLWEKYNEDNNLPDIIFKKDVIKFLKETYTIENQCIQNNYNKIIDTNNAFRFFWNNYIEENINDELEISEFYRLFLLCIENNNINITVIEEEMNTLIKYFFPYIKIINNKVIQNISCNTWDKKKSVLDAINNKFKKKITNDLSLYDAYIMYCKYINKENKGYIVSKEYFFKYIDKILPLKYIENNSILLSYWNELSTS